MITQIGTLCLSPRVEIDSVPEDTVLPSTLSKGDGGVQMSATDYEGPGCVLSRDGGGALGWLAGL